MANKATRKPGLMVSICLLVIASTAAGKIIYVDDDAVGANDGSTWENAYNFLQDASTDANSSEKPVEIRVAQGVYAPDSNSAVPEGTRDRWATFHLINGVSLKGGYAGFGEPNPDGRDFSLYETIVSGDLNCDDGPDFSNNGENSMQVVTGSGTDETAVFDGFTVIAGRSRGAGMCNYFASPIVNNCTFSRNSASLGGGMYNNNSSPTLTNCTFSANKADFGAGICNSTNSSPILVNCTFTANSARVGGGGMWNMGDSGPCRPTLTDCTFSSNSAKELGGGMYNRYSSPTLTDCMFSRNSADFFGAGMYNKRSHPMLTNCMFCRNSAGDMGGGIYNGYFSSPMLSGCIFSGNSAHGTLGGGGMINGGGKYGPSNPILTNCTFTGNFTNGNGGAILNVRIGPAENNPTLTNCTFAANSGTNGNALACVVWDPLYPAEIEIVNCILWDGGDEIWSDDGSAITVAHSNVQGGQAGVYDPREGLIWGAGNIDVDPLFVDPGYWDPNGTPDDANDDFWVDGDYHLKSRAGRYDPNPPSAETWAYDNVTSPCIDAGNPMSPIGHELFPNGGIINMGTYGGTAEASKSYFGKPPCKTIIAGDIDGDCTVNFKDFTLLALHWLTDNSP